jgi:hypothetical protein
MIPLMVAVMMVLVLVLALMLVMPTLFAGARLDTRSNGAGGIVTV